MPGGSSVDTVALVVAGAAFVVALLSLYLGNVKRADIALIWLPDRPIRLGDHQVRRDEGPPQRAAIWIPVAVVNAGARPGIVTGLDVERTHTRFITIEESAPLPNFRDGALGALPVLAGETQVLIVSVTTAFAEESVAAWRSGEFSSFDIVISYSYLRGRRIRPSATRRLRVRVPVADIASRSRDGE